MLHAGLRGTHGAAVAVLETYHASATVRYCGIGNIAARILVGGTERALVSNNGTAGHEAGRIQTFTYQSRTGGFFVMHSDGIATKWRLEDYSGLVARHPSVIAAVLFRDFVRARDDRTVIVACRRGNVEVIGESSDHHG